MAEQIDWSKAGTRLRRTPPTPADGGRNPDWNWVERRWKVAEEYAADTLSIADVFAKVTCRYCAQPAGQPCHDVRDRPMDGPHKERRFDAGAALIAEGWQL